MNLRVAAVAALPFLAACESFTAPSGAYLFTPPDSLFAAHWQAMEACSGISGDRHRITWYAVPDQYIPHPDAPRALGVWVKPHTVYLVERVIDGPGGEVPHEMLHDLLQTGDHPSIFAACGVQSVN